MFKIPYHFLHSLPSPSLGRVGVGLPFALIPPPSLWVSVPRKTEEPKGV